jgi:hypothetical protein
MPTPEDKARENIDRLLTLAGWAVRDQSEARALHAYASTNAHFQNVVGIPNEGSSARNINQK